MVSSWQMVLGGFLVDFISKQMVCRKLPEEKKIPLYKEKVYLWHRKNRGISYGFFQQKMSAIVAISGLVLGGCVFWLRHAAKEGSHLEQAGLSLLLGGAMGNWLERLRHKRVTDFIYIKGKHAPVFNIADGLIWVGALLVLLANLWTKKEY